MAKVSKDRSVGNLHPREPIYLSGNIGAPNAEVVIDCDGSSTVAVDLRGTFNLTIEVAGTVDSINWTPIPVKPVNQASKLYVAAISGSTPGTWVGACAGFLKVRARCTAFTTGAATTFLAASTVALDQSLDGQITSQIATNTAAVSTAVTLTIASPGSGLRQFLTFIAIERVNGTTAALTPSATPIVITTTNLPGSLAFTRASDALAAGATEERRIDFNYPLAALAQNAVLTIVCPAVTGVIWRVTAGWYVAP